MDQVQLDLKLMDPRRHERFTGQDNRRILDNLRLLAAAGRPALLPRVPLIPGVNMNPANLEQTAALLGELGLRRVALRPYHRLGEGKRAALRRADPTRAAALAHLPGGVHPPSAEQVAAAAAVFRARDLEVLDSEGGPL